MAFQILAGRSVKRGATQSPEMGWYAATTLPPPRRKIVLPNDERGVNTDEAAADLANAFLALYDRALPEVYGYLLHRCGDEPLAEDLTSDVFLAAARSVSAGAVGTLSIAWLITVARNKLVDYWRRQAREERGLHVLGQDPGPADPLDDIEEGRALVTLRRLPASYQAVISLRYLDGLPVSQVAVEMGKTLHATESLLARARAAFRRDYLEVEDD